MEAQLVTMYLSCEHVFLGYPENDLKVLGDISLECLYRKVVFTLPSLVTDSEGQTGSAMFRLRSSEFIPKGVWLPIGLSIWHWDEHRILVN